MENMIVDSFVKNCSFCGSRNACCNINDDIKPCEYWYYGNGYGSIKIIEGDIKWQKRH
jgi:hypothetical protein